MKLAVAALMTSLCALSANATILNSQSEWQATASDYGINPLTTINLTTATYVNVYIPHPSGGDALTLSLNAAPFEVTFDDQCALCAGDGFPGVDDGSVSNLIARRNSLQITFGAPIYGFGGIFNVPAIPPISDPLDAVETVFINGQSNPNDPIMPGFDGFTSVTPFSTVFVYSGDCSSGNSPNCGANISISDMQVSTVPTPEPTPAAFVLLAAPVLLFVCNRCRFKAVATND